MKYKGFWVSEYSRITTPLNIVANWRGDVDNLKKSLGFAFTEFISIFKGNSLTLYNRLEDSKRLSQLVAQKTINNKGFVKRVDQEIKKEVRSLLRIAMKIHSLDLRSMSNRQLMGLMDKFITAYSEIFSYGLVVSMDSVLNKAFKNLLDKKIKEANKSSEYFTILTAPMQKTIYREEEEELLKIVILVSKSKKIQVFFRKKASFIRDNLVILESSLMKKIIQLSERYGWLYINYEGKPRSVVDFIEEIQAILFRKKIRPTAALRLISKKQKRLIQQQKSLEKELGLNTRLVNLSRAIRRYAYLREYRKPQCVKALFYFRDLIHEIAKRLEISFRETKFLLPQEIKKALISGKIDRKEIKRRMNFCVFYNSINQEFIITGLKAKNFIKKMEIIPATETDQIKGVTASVGMVTGKARLILSIRDLKKFKKNDIIITKATSPDFVSIMKDALAIITDEGGLTSHAAIISRELNIPCVVGTKVATKKLRDGDFIEVNAYTGMVKKIK